MPFLTLLALNQHIGLVVSSSSGILNDELARYKRGIENNVLAWVLVVSVAFAEFEWLVWVRPEFG